MTKMTPTSRIIEVAILLSQMDQYTEEQPDLIARHKQLTKDFTGQDYTSVLIAYKLRQGKPYTVCSDDPELIDAAKAIAAHMEATVEETPVPTAWQALGADAGTYTIVLRPVGGRRN